MPKYMVQASYTVDGIKGLINEGASARRGHIEQLMQGLGGRLETFYFAFGEADVVAIAELPDAVTATALSLAINAGGAVSARTTVLITPEEMDQATKKSVGYRPPQA